MQILGFIMRLRADQILIQTTEGDKSVEITIGSFKIAFPGELTECISRNCREAR